MDNNGELLPSRKVVAVTAHRKPEMMDGKTLATSDHEVIQQWARTRQAEPATGERTPSGPATLDLNDGGAGVRFNFPGVARFRPIGWEEWFENFDKHQLVFVYEEHMPDGNVSTRHRVVTSDRLDHRQVV